MTFFVSTTRSARVAGFALALVCVVSAACGNKKKDAAAVQSERALAAANVEGLDALPADVHVVVGANVPMLAGSPLVKRAFAQMLARDAELAERLTTLAARCKLDPAKDLSSVLVGLMGTTSERDVVLVAKGKFDEPAIASCVEATLAERGGRLEKKPSGEVTVYLVHNSAGAGEVAFTFGAKDVLLVADSEALLLRARDASAAKLSSNPRMMKLIKQTDSRAGLWGAGELAPEVASGLVNAAQGKIKQPAQAIYGFVSPDSGLAVEVALEMASADDARGLLEVVQKQLAQYAVIAQAYSLGPVVNKIKPEARGALFIVTLTLDSDELARLESLLDRKAPSAGPEQGKEGTSP